MTVLIYMTSLLLILTKFMDCWSTARKIRDPMHEQNPLMRRSMMRFGVHTVIWLVFIVSILIIIVAQWLVLNIYDSQFMQWGYIAMGILISVIQLAVWRTNETGRLNYITRAVMKII